MQSDEKIDIVLTWVDGGDIEWQRERNRYAGKDPQDLANYRFRDMGTLKYWFRGIEKYAPWVNNIFFVTCGQLPEWLNTNNPKLKLVKHEDYIPKEYLPTFSSHPIELNFHRIKDLSNKFVYFNDDCFLTKQVDSETFFKNGLPKYSPVLDIIRAGDEMFEHILLNDVQFLNRHFKKRECMKKNFQKWYSLKNYGMYNVLKTLCMMPYGRFSNFYGFHIPTPLLKSTYDEIWSIEKEKLEEVCKNKFRTGQDVNQYIFSWYDIARGEFVPRNVKDGKYYKLSSDNKEICNDIENQKYKYICINDTSEDIDFEKVKRQLINSFDKILPDKSSFEL